MVDLLCEATVVLLGEELDKLGNSFAVAVMSSTVIFKWHYAFALAMNYAINCTYSQCIYLTQ